MNILIRRSSARTSYTEISPEVKPIPTTSMAGDCVSAVIAHEGTSLVSGAFGAETKRDGENLWMQVLKVKLRMITVYSD